MLALNPAVGARCDPTGIPLLHQPIKAGIVIREPLVELHDCEAALGGNAICVLHGKISVSPFLPYVKGYLRIHQTFAISLPRPGYSNHDPVRPQAPRITLEAKGR
jgi:hypothetical protein